MVSIFFTKGKEKSRWSTVCADLANREKHSEIDNQLGFFSNVHKPFTLSVDSNTGKTPNHSAKQLLYPAPVTSRMSPMS